MNTDTTTLGALKAFAKEVADKSSGQVQGAPEDQLRGPFERFLKDAAGAMRLGEVVCAGEVPLGEQIGRPDYAVMVGNLLSGHVELKAPGAGAIGRRFKGRDKKQFNRFRVIPNLLYTDGNQWVLYRGGKQEGRTVNMSGDIVEDGENAISTENASALEPILRGFLGWKPILPINNKGEIDFRGFADMLAPLCRLLREEVTDALRNSESPIAHIKKEWRQMLFPLATDKQFADAYAQTVVFALLLGRGEGAEPFTTESAAAALAVRHSLLSRALQILTEHAARADIAASLGMLLRLIAAVPSTTFNAGRDLWLYFYEDFLAAYDPKLRKDAGVYYTPVEVVRAQVRLLDDLLVNRFNKPLGFAESDVATLDPAVGTGTYLLGIIEHTLDRVRRAQGEGAVAGHAEDLAARLYGFEIMVGAYAVADLRVTRTLTEHAGGGGIASNVLLCDTLESPHKDPPELSLYVRPISEQRTRAIKVKRNKPVLVCLGNPPYHRHGKSTVGNQDRTGSWVRWGDGRESEDPILKNFIEPVTKAGLGVHLKNIYNLYVYFWRWALWKVFEQDGKNRRGAVSFITASSWLDGDAFLGMREHVRRICDDVWILDIGGGNLGSRRSENVFAIRTPVAIAVVCRTAEEANKNQPARVRYARIEGTREEKLAALDGIRNVASVTWQDCPDGWHAPFRPAGEGEYFAWPLLTDILPWRHSGVQLKRSWPIAPDEETLARRWRELLQSRDRRKAFRETGDRKINGTYRAVLTGQDDPTPISALPDDAPMPGVREYAYRSFDRQYVIADGRLMSRHRPHSGIPMEIDSCT